MSMKKLLGTSLEEHEVAAMLEDAKRKNLGTLEMPGMNGGVVRLSLPIIAFDPVLMR